MTCEHETFEEDGYIICAHCGMGSPELGYPRVIEPDRRVESDRRVRPPRWWELAAEVAIAAVIVYVLWQHLAIWGVAALLAFIVWWTHRHI